MIKFKIIVAAILAIVLGSLAGSAMSAEKPNLRKVGDKKYEYTFHHEINDETMADLINFYKTAPEGSEITIDINSPGGHVSTTLELMELVLNAQVRTSCKVNNLAASGAAYFLMTCGKIELSDKALVLFHAPYRDTDGQGGYMRNPFIVEKFTNIMNDVICFKDFMGNTMYERYLMGHDIVFNKQGMQDVINKSCRLKGDLHVVGH
jgi:hypothetical protein